MELKLVPTGITRLPWIYNSLCGRVSYVLLLSYIGMLTYNTNKITGTLLEEAEAVFVLILKADLPKIICIKEIVIHLYFQISLEL